MLQLRAGHKCEWLVEGVAMMRRVLTGALLSAAALLLIGPAPAADKEQVQAAIQRGVAHLKEQQTAYGYWSSYPPGGTALAALTLLECDLPPTDPAIKKAADYLRRVWPEINDEHTTYALSLLILFFDRLGDDADVPIIQALGVRLLAGQNSAGGWSYNCPPLVPEEIRQLRTLLQRQAELKAARELPKPVSGDPRAALPKEIQSLIARMERQGPAAAGQLEALIGSGGDNSNTQFALLGLWAARRHGIPVERALTRAAARFRESQQADGGWGYMPSLRGMPGYGAPTPSMTCAGLLGLAFGHGSAREARLRAGVQPKPTRGTPMKTPPEPEKDPGIRGGFLYLARVVGKPIDEIGLDGPAGGPGDMYYLLWSVERVAVAYSLPTIGDVDWYTWGATLLLPRQQAKGGWNGKFGLAIDTSFALLFLRRANLAGDLSTYLKSSDLARVTLKSRDAGSEKGVKPPDTKPTVAERGNQAPMPGAKKAEPESATATEATAKRLSEALVNSTGRPQEQALAELTQAKGVAYTEALATAIGQLSGPIKAKAREALAERLSRMTAATLREKLGDQAAEIRRAAALACAMKEEKQLIPDLIELLEDRQALVARAALAALKDMTGQDLGPAADATATARSQAVAAWKYWWQRQRGP
jgi:hypothetical protein